MTPSPQVSSSKIDQRPTIQIISHKRHDLRVRLKGKAMDDGGISRVEVMINGRLRHVTGTANWNAKLRLKKGKNRIVARAFDNAAKVSAPKRVLIVVAK